MDALALLRLQIEWGADEALADQPVDRLRDLPPPAAIPVQAAAVAPTAFGRRPSPAPAAAAEAPAQRALAAALAADSLPALRDAVAAFDLCPLRDMATNTVFAAGDPDGGLLLIGDPPGAEEDRTGTPFAGREGALLDAMLASIGLRRDQVLLAPLIPWRPPGGRVPNAGELALCLPFLHRLITLAAPRRVVLLGTQASRALLGQAARRRGSPVWQDCVVPGHSRPIHAISMPSPGMMLVTTNLRRDAWNALRMLRRTLDADAPRN